MRKKRDFVFLRPVRWLGIGMMAALTVTALDANDNIIKDRIFENVPIIRNQVTRYTGSFFGSGGGGGGETGSGDFRMTADPDWDAVNGYTF